MIRKSENAYSIDQYNRVHEKMGQIPVNVLESNGN